MSLANRWESESPRWIQWARSRTHDSYWRHHRDQFLSLLPAPGRLTLDIGCGEGRLTRHLRDIGHRVTGIDVSQSLLAAARCADPSVNIVRGDAAALPFRDAVADLAVALMSLHDMDAMPDAVREIARVLKQGGKFCIAIVHPINSAGRFAGTEPLAPFVIKRDYLHPFRYADTVERDGLTMTFHSEHRPLEAYFSALEDAGFLIEALREPGVPDHAIISDGTRRWQRIPLFLHIRACLP